MESAHGVPMQLTAQDLGRFTGNLPRYTSYPTAPQWKPLPGPRVLEDAWASVNQGNGPLSLYVHVPFCRKQCWYCACNQEVSRNAARMDAYVDAVLRELEILKARVGTQRPLVQVHLGGGTPTHLPPASFERLCRAVMGAFPRAADAEVAVEVHPGITGAEHVSVLRELGFNRISVGVQDFDPRVQDAVNRHQSVQQVEALVKAAWDAGMRGVNVDLMYGLPFQTPESFASTVETVLRIAPDRVALFGYAHVPHMKAHQKLLQVETLPPPGDRWTLFATALHRFRDAGYVHVGMDHFARPGDAMAQARGTSRLRRNFMGYTVAPPSTLLALGASAIADLGGVYLQNEPDTDRYIEKLSTGQDPVVRTCMLTDDDQLRRDILQALFCQLTVDLQEVGGRHGIRDAAATFSAELARIRALQEQGLARLEGTRVSVTPLGQVLLRQVASVFDAYLRTDTGARYSQAV